jgi:hypothetical protein
MKIKLINDGPVTIILKSKTNINAKILIIGYGKVGSHLHNALRNSYKHAKVKIIKTTGQKSIKAL